MNKGPVKSNIISTVRCKAGSVSMVHEDDKYVGRNIGECFIGSCTLPSKLIGFRYLRFLRRYLLQLLGMPFLRTRQQVWFLYDGAPAHLV
jgi:hypothetical protein